VLFLKSLTELLTEDVEHFCRTFQENIRVEYKSTFDESVKNKLPRVVSSFANSYGGILIIGVNARNGTPEEPFDGIRFEDREPRLTLENICRSHIFPEVPVRATLVPSRVSGNAFMVVQVNESPKAPHAIENSTRVYVRSGDSSDRTTLADIHLIQQLILRRRDVLSRWTEFYDESNWLAGAVGIEMRARPLLDVRVGPLYPTDVIIPRERVFSFLSNYFQAQQGMAGISFSKTLRHPAGAFLVRDDYPTKYFNVGELGAIHYLEPLRPTDYHLSSTSTPSENELYPLWWIVKPVLDVLDTAGRLFREFGVGCDLRIETTLLNASGRKFTLATGSQPTLDVTTISRSILASATSSSELLSEEADGVATDLLYQLRWPFGTEAPQTRDQITSIVAWGRRKSPL
jgi:hypothetical protein